MATVSTSLRIRGGGGFILAAPNIIGNGGDKCPFCRTPEPTSDEEMIKRLKKRIEAGDTYAIFGLGCLYDHGEYGLTQDHEKALKLWQQAAELGCVSAYYGIGTAYYNGRGVERDEKKANHFDELAAMGGDPVARQNLGCLEQRLGNWDRALKHFMIAAGDGYKRHCKTSVEPMQRVLLPKMITQKLY